MKDYIEQVLHQVVLEKPYDEATKLPLGIRSIFILNILTIEDHQFIFAEPNESMNLTELRKMRIQLERYTGFPCVFYLKNVNWYAAPKMVEEGIPFVWENHQVYLPCLGMLLKKNAVRTPKLCNEISFLTQKLLLKALYDNWQGVSATQAAERLEVSRMSITRCFDEIEALDMPFLKKQNRSRKFYAIVDRKEMWHIIHPVLRNPVIKTFRLNKTPGTDMILSGTTALSFYSMLEDDAIKTYAVSKDQVKKIGLKNIREVSKDEEPECIIHELGYILPYLDNKAVDPLSLTLTLTEEEFSDPRVESSVKEMQEELIW